MHGLRQRLRLSGMIETPSGGAWPPVSRFTAFAKSLAALNGVPPTRQLARFQRRWQVLAWPRPPMLLPILSQIEQKALVEPPCRLGSRSGWQPARRSPGGAARLRVAPGTWARAIAAAWPAVAAVPQ